MSPLILLVLVAVAVVAAGFALVPSLATSSRADKRMKALRGEIVVSETGRLDRARDSRRRQVQEVVRAQTRALEEKKRRVPLQLKLYQAGMTLKKEAYIRNAVLLGIAVFVVCFLLEIPWHFSAVFAVAAAYLVPRWYVGRRRKKFQSAFLDELPNAVEAIVRGVKSGLPLNDSIRVVAKEVKEPVRSEFARVLDQQAVGKSMTEAVATLVDRIPLPEVNFFVVVITVQQQAGGNLSEALGNLSRVLRNRKKMKQKVKAMSSEAKASAIIIGSLPFVVAGLVTLVTPNYLSPLYTTTIGYICLGAAAVLMSMGIFIMNRMVQFEY